MEHICYFRKCIHLHLKRYYHSKQAQYIDCSGNFCVYPADIPCTHGTEQNDCRYGEYCDKHAPSECLDQIGLLDAPQVVLKPYEHLVCWKSKRLFADICFLLKRVDKYKHDRIYIHQTDNRENGCQDPAVFCLSYVHYCCTLPSRLCRRKYCRY